MTQDMAALAQRFAIDGSVRFEAGDGGLTRIAIATPAADAHVYLHGAHVTHYQPAGASQPVLFMSRCSQFAPGQPIRGGVPICFPWFGAKADDAKAPGHGTVRLREWQLQQVAADGDDVMVELATSDDDASRAFWPHRFDATMRVVVGSALEMTLRVTNKDQNAFTFTEALHTYLQVGDVRQVRISGLENSPYFSKVEGAANQRSAHPIAFTAETDRVYENTEATCVLEDPIFQRKILLDKSGSKSTVVWNPWIKKSAAMPDFGDDEWPGMVCIETANARGDAVTLQPGESHEMTARIVIAE